MIERILRLIRMDFSVFKEIESDPSATTEAAIVVAVSTLLSALGSAIGSDQPTTGFIASVISGIVGWLVWSAVTYIVGKSVFKGGGTLEQMLRVLGYASVPNILGVFSFIPCFGWIAGFAGWILALVAGVMAIKEAMDVELGTAIGVTVVGAIAMGIVFAIIGLIFGGAVAIGAVILGLLGRQ